MTIISRLKFPALCLLGTCMIYLLYAAVWHAGVSYGATALDTSHSVSTATLDDSWAMISTYGWIWGGMAVVLALASWVLKRNDSTHWIAQGRTLALIVGGLGIAAAALDAKFAGAPLSGVAMTAIAALFKLMDPRVTPAAPAPAPQSNSLGGGSGVTMFAILLIGAGLVASQPGCAEVKPRLANAAGAAIDCEAPGIVSLVTELVPVARQSLMAMISPDGRSVDKTAWHEATAALKSDQLRCAFATALALLATPSPTLPAGPAAAPLEVNGAALRSAFASLRAERGWGDTKTSSGTL